MSREKQQPTLLKWLHNAMDDIDYAFVEDGEDMYQFSSLDIETTIAARQVGFRNFRRDDDWGKFVPALTQKLIRAHLDRELTLYYKTAPFRGGTRRYWMLCIDIDWKVRHVEEHGADSDALDCAEFINHTWLADAAYAEKSRSGLGAHLYFALEIDTSGFVDIEDIVARLDCCISKMSEDCVEEGYLAHVELHAFGTPNVIEQGMVVRRGIMASAPRPQSKSDEERLRSIEPVSLDALEQELCHAPGSALSQNNCNQLGDNKCPMYTKPAVEIEQWRELPPHRRMILSTFSLARKLGRVPTDDEAVAYYEACEIHTGDDVSGHRLRRARKAVAECAKTFDADKATPQSERTDFRDHLPLIRARISQDDLRAASPDRQVLTYEDICLLYEAMTFAILHDDSPYGWPQLGKAWAKKVFDEKKQRGEHLTGCNGAMAASAITPPRVA